VPPLEVAPFSRPPNNGLVNAGMVLTMTNNDMSVRPPASPVTAQENSAQGRAPAVPSSSLPKTTVEDVGKAAIQTKGQSVDKLAENAAEIREAVREINAAVKKVPTSLDFSVDEASKRFVVSVTDTSTGEVIRKLPGDAVLRIARQLESLKGVMFDQKF
jgi:flagellar protein FlaG|tara:strand:+ start:2185 stop:2661 length:477 start_codon:yes stop_codon:yes gene_type:complete